MMMPRNVLLASFCANMSQFESCRLISFLNCGVNLCRSVLHKSYIVIIYHGDRNGVTWFGEQYNISSFHSAVTELRIPTAGTNVSPKLHSVTENYHLLLSVLSLWSWEKKHLDKTNAASPLILYANQQTSLQLSLGPCDEAWGGFYPWRKLCTFSRDLVVLAQQMTVGKVSRMKYRTNRCNQSLVINAKALLSKFAAENLWQCR